MTVSLTHGTVATGTNNADKQVSVNAWNEEHTLTGTANTVLGFDATGEATELAIGAASASDIIDRAAGDARYAQADQALNTTDSPQFAGVNVGHASDTTISRASAGVIAVEGVNVVTTAGGVTFAADIGVPDEAYDATAWNGSVEVPTKNAVRDKIESLGSGALVYLATYSPSAVASFDIEDFAGLSNRGKAIIEFEYLTVSADSVGVTMQFKLNSAYKTASYKWSRRNIFAATTASNNGSASDSNISLFLTGAGGMGAAAGEGGSATVEILNPYDTAGQKRLVYRANWIDDQATPRQCFADGAGSYSGTDYASALGGVRIATSSGTMSGKVHVYVVATA